MERLMVYILWIPIQVQFIVVVIKQLISKL